MTTLKGSLDHFSTRRETLIETGHKLLAFLKDAQMMEKAREVSGHLMRLEVDSVKVAVLGEFKAGKSTLINAIIGSEVLPTWTVECTAAITQMGYGEEPCMRVHKTDGTAEKHQIDQLKVLATTRNDNFENIAYIEAQYPAELLRNGLVIVDTPGMNSAVKARALITKKFMKIADAAILVLNVEYLLKQSEVQFIRDEISQSNYGAVFVVVNRCDLYSDQPEQLKAALDKAAVRLKELIPNLDRIYPVSALQALEGREDDDTELVAASRIEDLENDIGRYVMERGALDRLERTAAAFSDILAETGNECRMRLAGLNLDKEKADVYARKAKNNLQQERDRLSELQKNIREGFAGMKTRLADDIRQRSLDSRRNLESLYGGTHTDPPEAGVIEERIANDSRSWLTHAERKWTEFHDNMLIYTSNYLAAIDQELTQGLVTAAGGSLLEVQLSPARVQVQTKVREQTEYVEEYQKRPKTPAKDKQMSGLGVGLMLGGLILGGWLGAGLAIFGGASLFGGMTSNDDEDEMEKIRKPVTKQIKSFTLASLESPYHQLTTQVLKHLDKVLEKAHEALLAQVQQITQDHHTKIKTRVEEIEHQRTNEGAPKEVARLQKIMTRVEELTGQVKASYGA